MVGVDDLLGGGMGSPVTLSQALLAWLEFRSRFWTAAGTKANYQLAIRHWLSVLGEDAFLQDISPVDVQRLFLAEDNGKRSGAWVDKSRDMLHQFFAWAVGLRLIAENPVTIAAWPRAKGKRSDRSRIPVRITSALLEQIVDITKIRYHRLWHLLYLTGVHVGTLLRGRRKWMVEDPKFGWLLQIPGAARKTRRACVVVLCSRAVEILGTKGDPEDLLFPEAPRSTSTVRQALYRAGRKLGIARLSLHNFRKSYSTALLNSGVPLPAVCNQLGWASAPREALELVQEHYYLGLEADAMRRATDKLMRPPK